MALGFHHNVGYGVSFIVSPSDYIGFVRRVVFPSCENRLCIPITINDDHLVENAESFNITVEKYSGIGNELTIESSEGRIIIKDTDGI